ncbi:catechol 2,3-dioxygenase-like lactoylglutathione lyase family enzyme [Nocardioides luteus]|uniref:Glyoxalase n=1 Tax=Nocardioides luteus TaxID=1844 RepID=A0ABQ5SUP4_9ACTN|nr:VOC family protein [Nocardioides luteus]MDR7309476.1 catechol 2,3-dioxygenase-like lactoylglutathione lyase family enzyme [Nocardioides luteus]GGR51486.1 glyoxalase [Nocardioides luteus]GLJ67882.1 glyoxalase [Nocardioides luteus]
MAELLQTVLDTTDVRRLAEFYRQLLGLTYRLGDEEPSEDEDWLVLTWPDGRRALAFNRVDESEMAPSHWPAPGAVKHMHLDLTVSSVEELDADHARALALGAELRLDRTDDPDEPLRAYADPAGHIFCILVA